MTGMDTFFVVMAIVDVIAVAGMVYVAARMLDTLKQGQQQAEPAIREAKAVAEMGKALAIHARDNGTAVAGRIKNVATKVQRRFQTTRQIVTELAPPTREAAEAARAAQKSVKETATSIAEIARGMGRIRAAAEAANRARSG